MGNPYYAALTELNRAGRRRGVEDQLMDIEAVGHLRTFAPLNENERKRLAELVRRLQEL